jgi:hypothetical protein
VGQAKLRMGAGDKPYVTDNSNYIVDLYFEEPIKDAYAGALQLPRSSLRSQQRLTAQNAAQQEQCAW